MKEGIEYGLPYEHHKKAHKTPAHKGIAPRNPTAERKTDAGEAEEFESKGLKPR